MDLCLVFGGGGLPQYEALQQSRVQIHLFLMVLEKCQCLPVYFAALLLCCCVILLPLINIAKLLTSSFYLHYRDFNPFSG